jgi:hypothetical protein
VADKPVSRIVMTKLLLMAAGIAVWATGVRMEERTLQWVGLAALVLAFLLRFTRRSEGKS